MPSIKRTRKYITLILAIIVIMVIYGNLVLVTRVQDESSQSITMVQELKKEQLKYNYPFRVIRNVVEYGSKNEYKISEAMENGYEKSVVTGKEINQNITNLVVEIRTLLSTSYIKNLQSYSSDLERIRTLLREIEKLNSEFSVFLQLDIAGMGSLDGEYVVNAETKLHTYIEELEEIFEDSREEMVSKIVIATDIGIIALVIMIILLLAILYRFVFFQDRFIRKSYKLVEEHDYDVKKIRDIKPIFKEEKEIIERVHHVFEEQKISIEAKEIVRNSYDMDTVLEKLFDLSKSVLGVNRIGIAFVDDEKGRIVAEGAAADYTDLKLGTGYGVKITESTLSKVIETKKGMITNDVYKEYQKRKNSPSLRIIIEEGIQSNMVLPIISGDEVFGLMFFSSEEKNYFTKDHERIGTKILYEVSEILKRSYLIKVVFNRFARSIADLVDNRDSETGDHLDRMTAYSLVIANALQQDPIPGYEVDRKFIEELKMYAPTHDIGKVAIPDKILKKPGKLTAEEYNIMKTHVVIGAEVIHDIRKTLQIFDKNYFKMSEEIILGHHEKWDGSGYPYGVIGEDIPLSGRITAIADVFDALTSQRVYKSAFSFQEALSIMQKEKGKQFDPVLLDIFVENMFKVKEIYREKQNIVEPKVLKESK